MARLISGKRPSLVDLDPFCTSYCLAFPYWRRGESFSRLDSPSLLRALVVDRCFGGVAGVSPVFGWCLPRGFCRSYGSSSRVLAEERTGWSRTSNDGRWIFSCLARPRLDCCTRSQIRVGALRARTGPRGKGDEAVSLEELYPNLCSLLEREAGGARALKAIGVGSGHVLIDLLVYP